MLFASPPPHIWLESPAHGISQLFDKPCEPNELPQKHSLLFICLLGQQIKSLLNENICGRQNNLPKLHASICKVIRCTSAYTRLLSLIGNIRLYLIKQISLSISVIGKTARIAYFSIIRNIFKYLKGTKHIYQQKCVVTSNRVNTVRARSATCLIGIAIARHTTCVGFTLRAVRISAMAFFPVKAFNKNKILL